MQRIAKNTILQYIPDSFLTEKHVNPNRIKIINQKKSNIEGYIVYLCEREIRAKDNFALQFALQTSKEKGLPLKIIHPKINYISDKKQKFIDTQILQTEKIFQKSCLDFKIINEEPSDFLTKLKTAILIIDFNPVLKRNYLKNVSSIIYEIDGHNIVPARFVSDKQEYNAATFRRKIYYNIFPFLTEYDNLTSEKTEADFILEAFIKNKLSYYAEYKNNPGVNVLSGLSKYLNLGFISAQRIALEVLKSDADIASKEVFLEELIVRKELADNFCLYAKNFKDLSSVPNWAKMSLKYHQSDLRTYTYSVQELENAQTHDKLWNAAQTQLKTEGTIHGYLRMYWAKKLSEWIDSPEEALNTAIFLNDKYAYDSPSTNGYTGILWAIGGLHDRAFADFPVTGKIRKMTLNSIRKKYDLSDYLNKYCVT